MKPLLFAPTALLLIVAGLSLSLTGRGVASLVLIPMLLAACGIATFFYIRLRRVMCDITQLKDVGKKARESEDRFRKLFNGMNDSFSVYEIIHDSEGKPRDLRVLDANDSYEKLTGRKTGDVVGKKVSEFNPDLNPFWIKAFAEVAETGRSRQIDRYSRNIGKYVEVVLFRPRAGQCAVIARDVTKRKKLEDQLRKATRMEAIGQLAGGIAHDYNNLLTAILGYANILKLESEPGSSFNDAAETIEIAAERAAELTRQLLGFARKGKYRILPVDLHETVHDTVALLSRSIDKNIRIELALEAPSATVMGDPGQLQQVLLNLAVNARDAMPDGGVLSFRTEVVPTGGRNGGGAGESVQFCVSDTGCGIPEDVLERVFEPFFSTKGVGKGTGMGLAMAYGIVENHGGTLAAESREGEGAIFRMCLPLSVENQAPAPRSELISVPGNTRRVLIVDDEEVVRDVASHLLRSLGCEVVTASDGREAVELYARQGRKIDLVLLDMIMPEMGGRECFLALKAIDPGVQVILSTGYGLEGRARELLDEGMLGFVQKPYRLDQLKSALCDALEKPVDSREARELADTLA
jgi:two-component system, cell cycle sensor histidine kinase and response regulator CckA